MSALTTTREALAQALGDTGIEVAPHRSRLELADALLASGAVIDAATLADDICATLRNEGEPNHPGEFISVNEAQAIVREVFAEVAR